MRPPRDSVWRWLLSAALSVAVCQALWWWSLRDPALAGLAQAVGVLSPVLWPDTVLEVRMQEHQPWIVSLIPTLTDPPRLFTVLPLKLNRALVIFPLFWGLTLATPGKGLPRRLLLGTALLLPIALGMALLTTQFEFALYRTHLPMLSRVPPADFLLALPDTPTAYYLSGLGRQISVLVLPLVAPLLVWLGLHEAFLRTLRHAGVPKPRNPPSVPSPHAISSDPAP